MDCLFSFSLIQAALCSHAFIHWSMSSFHSPLLLVLLRSSERERKGQRDVGKHMNGLHSSSTMTTRHEDEGRKKGDLMGEAVKECVQARNASACMGLHVNHQRESRRIFARLSLPPSSSLVFLVFPCDRQFAAKRRKQALTQRDKTNSLSKLQS